MAKTKKVAAYVKQGDKALTVDGAKRLLGWKVVAKDEPAVFRDLNGDRIQLANNPSNRPFRMGWAKRYASEVIRKKWELNGETIVVDTNGHIQSGQHRLVGLIFAEQQRLKNPELVRERYGWRRPITMETIVVTGISPKKEVVDTLDRGQSRSLGDVLFRNKEWKGYKESEQKKLSNTYGQATRLVWLRTGGKTVSDAPHFPHSEALDFMAEHPGIKASTEFVFNEDGGGGAEGRKISTYIPLGTAAGLHYLMATAKTDAVKYADGGEVSEALRDKADQFWVLFASGQFPVLTRALVRIDSGGATGRDEAIGMVVKAWNRWIDDKEIAKVADIKVKRAKSDTGKLVLAETPRIGGLDVELEVLEPEEPAEPESKPEAPTKGSKSKDGWAAGDTAWIVEEDGEHYFGTVKEVYQTEEGEKRATIEADDGEWDVAVSQLRVSRPK